GVYGDTDDVVDMNGMADVDWQLLDSAGNPSTLGTIDKATGELTTGADEGELTVVASYPDAGEASVGVTIKSDAFKLEMCGSGVDDTDAKNAIGACLKVASNGGTWFTATPSIAVMTALGYTEASSKNNEGTTYGATIILENIPYNTGDLGGEEFALFRQDGAGVVRPGEGNDALAGVGGQLDRWCKHLGTMNFAGRSNWERPTFDQLDQLRTTHGDSLVNLGWPGDGRAYYWVKDIKDRPLHPFTFETTRLYDYGSGWATVASLPSSPEMASCVSTF
ncbi:hypothetical protein ACNZ70_001700, partial [Vibrio mimicus]